MKKIQCLDHGHVGLFEAMGSDLSIVRNARVSFDAEWRAGEDEGKDEKLLKYLLTHRHTSPFEAVTFTFDVRCPIFVARQWHRHRTWSYNEVSARYAELPADYYIPKLEDITTQSTSNKQARTDEQHPQALALQALIAGSCEAAVVRYRDLLDAGCPRELARGVLPVNTYTHFFATVDLHNLFHFLRLRLHPHAQREMRVYARALRGLIGDVVPVTTKLFRELENV